MHDDDWDNLVSNAAGCAFFCDSSFIDEDSDSWWRSLLRSPNLIFLIPHVMQESGEWLKRSSQHAASEAISSSDPKLILSDLKDLSFTECQRRSKIHHLAPVEN